MRAGWPGVRVIGRLVSPPPSIPDIWGVWMGLGGVTDADPRFGTSPFRLRSSPNGARWQSRRLASPITPGECNPWSPVMFMGGGGLFPIQIWQGPNVIVIHHEAVTQPRRIYTDGRAHPAPDEFLPSFLGHSIGRWEGDTLVVDTIGTNGRARPINGYVAGAVTLGRRYRTASPGKRSAAPNRAHPVGWRRTVSRERDHR